MTIVLAEHRLERCLAAADRVVAMDAGTIAFDGAPRGFLGWAQDADPALETPGGAPLFAGRASLRFPTGVRDARRRLAEIERGGRAPPPLNFRGKRGGSQ